MDARRFLNQKLRRKKRKFQAEVVAILTRGTWFTGGALYFVSDGLKDVFADMTDAEKRKVHPSAPVLARIISSKRFVCFREEELRELEIQ